MSAVVRRYVAIHLENGRQIRIPIPKHLTDEEVATRFQAVMTADTWREFDGAYATLPCVLKLRALIVRAFSDPN